MKTLLETTYIFVIIDKNFLIAIFVDFNDIFCSFQTILLPLRPPKNDQEVDIVCSSAMNEVEILLNVFSVNLSKSNE